MDARRKPTHLFNELTLPVPEVPAIIRDEQGLENPEGIVARAVLNDDLEVVVPAWPFSDDPRITRETVSIGWRIAGSGFVSVRDQEYPTPVEPGDKTLTVPQRELVHGTYDLSYRINQGGNFSFSLIKRVTIDTVPPHDHQQPAGARYPDELLGVITDDYLKQHGQVLVTVPSYSSMRAFDRAVFFWASDDPMPGDTPIAGEQTFSQDDIDNRRLLLPLAEDVIRDSGGGQRYLFYRLYDLAGNESPLSYSAGIGVDLVLAPENLPAPRIPLSARGLIDRQHAREGATNQGGVTVEIGRYDNAEASHFVIVNWGGNVLAEFAVDPSNFPLPIFVPWRELTANGLGPGTLQVSYQIRFGGSLTPKSPEVSVSFDFTIAGQDHANAPALLNNDLTRLEVRGEVSDRPDTLTAEDHGRDARVLLTLFEDPQPGEGLEVFWGAVAEVAARYQVQPGDVAGKPLTLSVPWRIVEQDLNNAALPVSYVTDNGVNQQQAPATAVQVTIVPIEGLKTPDFPHADNQGYLNCCSRPRIWEGVTIKVEGDSTLFAADDLVEVYCQGYEDLGSNKPIEGTLWSQRKMLSAAEARDGFEVVVPYLVFIEPMENNGSAIAYYTLTKVDGGFGSSRRRQVYINRTLPSGKVCGPDNDLCNEA
ncbi:hypothetical protein [Pseudomonas putida]|uniref:hypothetical protein n=1 Tax=Pseudomonas putida TaxID=303 RepID=UPI002365E03C|nr:hypothetical protein [Pseudomonas putida]MDD2046558.1 hypothetical protein [Pseudomonas putida]